MPTDIPLRCACGEIRGTALAASPTTGSRVICYCNDCQAFARFLGRPGVTDEHGGTDIYQLAPGRVRFTAGAEALRNTMGAGVPFVGLIHTIMDLAEGGAHDQALGERRGS